MFYRVLVLTVALSAISVPAFADEGGDSVAWPTGAAADDEASSPGFLGRDTLTGDWGGLRTRLDAAGLKLSGTYTGEVLGNPSGGIRQRGIAEGLLEVDIDSDLKTLAGWDGGTFHASFFQIHGRGESANFLGNLFTVRDIEAAPSTRVWSLWLQQAFVGDSMSVRVGQMPEQEEFVVSTLGGYFVNGTFGWPIGMAANMPSGGGAYPLAMTGIRYKAALSDSVTWMVAAFDGDPAPANGDPDPVRRNRNGLNFGFRDPLAYFNEFNYAVNQDKDAPGLATSVKFGGWVHAGHFSDLHWDSSGRSLGSPNTNGLPRQSWNDWGIYGIVDQMLTRTPGTVDGGLGVFSRVMVAPPDINTLPYYGEIGLTQKGTFDGRDDDVAGIAFAYGAISSNLAARDRDANDQNTPTAVRDAEAAVELLYRAQVAPWLTLVPDAQYIFHPGAGVGLPSQPATRIPDATVLGLRAVVKL